LGPVERSSPEPPHPKRIREITKHVAVISNFFNIFGTSETGSTWNVLGEATDGPLAGKQLKRPLSINAFWFAWGAFYERADIYDN